MSITVNLDHQINHNGQAINSVTVECACYKDMLDLEQASETPYGLRQSVMIARLASIDVEALKKLRMPDYHRVYDAAMGHAPANLDNLQQEES